MATERAKPYSYRQKSGKEGMPRAKCPAYKIRSIILSLLILLFIFCPRVAPAHTAQKVSLQLPWHHQFQFAGYYMAQEKGFYHDNGLEVEIRDVTQGQETVAEVLSGRATFGINGSGLLVERSQGKPVVAIAAIFQRSPTVFLTLEKSGIRRPADLVGKKVMLSPGLASLELLALLYQEHVFDKIDRLDTSFDYHSLITGQTDAFNAYRTNEPILVADSGYPYQIIDPAHYGINFFGDILFATEQTIQNNPKTVEKFRQASIAGWEYALNHSAETIEVIQKKYRVDKTTKQLEFEAAEIAKVVQAEVVPIGTMGLSRWAQINHHLIAIGALPPAFNFGKNFLYTPPEQFNWVKLMPWIYAVTSVVVILLAFVIILFRANRQLNIARREVTTSAQKYKAVINNQKDILLLHKVIPSGYAVFSEVNDAAVNFYGYTRAELLTKSPEDIVAPEIIAEHLRSGGRIHMLASGELSRESVHINKAGERIPVEISATLVEIAGETYILSMVHDIRQRKQSEQQIQRFSQIVQQSISEIYIIDKDTLQIIDVNAGGCKNLGYSLAELKTKTLLDIKSSHAREQVAEIIAPLLKGNTESLAFITEHQRKNGSCYPVEVFLQLVPESPPVFFAIVMDITERVKVENALRENEKQLAILYDQSPDMYVSVAPEDGTILRCNETLLANTGYSQDEVVGAPIFKMYHPECMDEVYKTFQQFVDIGEVKDKHLILKRKDGSKIEVSLNVNSVKDETGTTLYSLSCWRDITERIAAELQQAELETQLRQKHKMEAIGYMAGGIAHNFNNNLSIILGNIELSQMKQAADSEIISFLEEAKIAVRRSRDLVKQIITYSRKSMLHKVPTSLTQIIDETVELLRATLPTSINLQKIYPADGEAKLINAEAAQLQEVLLNLSNNAVQAMNEQGELKITLEAVTLQQQDIPAQYDCLPGRYAKLSVQDNGCGIPAEMLDKIFDPFYSTKEEYQGAGMGLATVQGIVAQHGGFIKVSSVLNQGATFEIYFPTIGNTAPENTSTAVQAERRSKGSERILFVDDDEMLALLGEKLLAKSGYQVSSMTDSVAALKMFTANAEQFDIVITDQTMPNLCGLELISELKKVSPDIPTILFTGYSSKIDEENAKKQGVSAFLMKPLELPKMLKTIRQVLDGEPNP
jgi:PAS domain S-box-containing protein